MVVVRPVSMNDLDALAELAALAGVAPLETSSAGARCLAPPLRDGLEKRWCGRSPWLRSMGKGLWR